MVLQYIENTMVLRAFWCGMGVWDVVGFGRQNLQGVVLLCSKCDYTLLMPWL